MGIFDLTGGPFLMLYGVLFLTAAIAGLLIPRWLQREGRAPAALQPEALAYLAGGASRYADTVIAGQLAARALALEAGGRLRALAGASVRRRAGGGALMLDDVAPWGKAFTALVRQARHIEAQLVDAGLMMDRAQTFRLRLLASAPWLLLLAIGLTKWEIGRLRDKPVGYLSLFLVVTVFALVVRFATVDRRTRAAHDLLATERRRGDRLRRAPRDDEFPLAVALFGTAVLSGSEFGGYHALRTEGGGDAGAVGADGGSDGGGGGCGGGGCGGCGGG